jgi:hypothetical protein
MIQTVGLILGMTAIAIPVREMPQRSQI